MTREEAIADGKAMGLEGPMLSTYADELAGPAAPPKPKKSSPPPMTAAPVAAPVAAAPVVTPKPATAPPPMFTMKPDAAPEPGAYEVYTGRYNDPRGGAYEQITGRPFYEGNVPSSGPPPITQTTAYQAGAGAVRAGTKVAGAIGRLADAAADVAMSHRAMDIRAQQIQAPSWVDQAAGSVARGVLGAEQSFQAGAKEALRNPTPKQPEVVVRHAPRPAPVAAPAPAPTPQPAAPVVQPALVSPAVAPDVQAMVDELVRRGASESVLRASLAKPGGQDSIRRIYNASAAPR